MGTDGSVHAPVATYSFVVSISQVDIQPNVKGGGFLPRRQNIWTHTQNVLKPLRFLQEIVHVKGHQDRHKQWD
jgi:hypothetical protein